MAGEDGTAPAATPVETEAKLHASRRAFRALEQALEEGQELDGWLVAGRREVRLRDTYWDTPDHRLAGRGCTLRVREQDGGPAAELTLKGPVSQGAAGSAQAGARSRTELTVEAPAGSTPATWARLPQAGRLMASLAEVGAADGLRPDVVLLNPRREFALRRGAGEAALSLDEVCLEGWPYRRRYVEIELKRGDPAALDALAQAVARRFQLRPSRLGKVQAARAWLARPRQPDAAQARDREAGRAAG